MQYKTTHKENITALRRIEGQVKGLQRMINEEEYCLDIITQIHAATNSLKKVAEKIFAKHLEHCVVDALKGKSEKDKAQKIHEIMDVVRRLHHLR